MLVNHDISVIYIIIDGLWDNSILCWTILLVLLTLKIIFKGRVISIFDGFKLSIRIEAEDGAKDIVNKAENRIRKNKNIHTTFCLKVDLILNGRKKIDHKYNGKEYANENENHNYLIL